MILSQSPPGFFAISKGEVPPDIALRPDAVPTGSGAGFGPVFAEVVAKSPEQQLKDDANVRNNLDGIQSVIDVPIHPTLNGGELQAVEKKEIPATAFQLPPTKTEGAIKAEQRPEYQKLGYRLVGQPREPEAEQVHISKFDFSGVRSGLEILDPAEAVGKDPNRLMDSTLGVADEVPFESAVERPPGVPVTPMPAVGGDLEVNVPPGPFVTVSMPIEMPKSQMAQAAQSSAGPGPTMTDLWPQSLDHQPTAATNSNPASQAPASPQIQTGMAQVVRDMLTGPTTVPSLGQADLADVQTTSDFKASLGANSNLPAIPHAASIGAQPPLPKPMTSEIAVSPAQPLSLGNPPQKPAIESVPDLTPETRVAQAPDPSNLPGRNKTDTPAPIFPSGTPADQPSQTSMPAPSVQGSLLDHIAADPTGDPEVLSVAQMETGSRTVEAPGMSPVRQLPSADLASRIAAQMAQSVVGLDGAIQITLDPVELGKVRMTLVTQDAGMSVQIVVERPETLDLMRRNVDLLATELHALGLMDLGFAFTQEENMAGRSAASDQADLAGSDVLESQTDTSATHVPAAPTTETRLDLRL